MKNILLTIIYPFWFLLSKTWLGIGLTLCLVPMALSWVILLLLPTLPQTEDYVGANAGVALISIFISLYCFYPLMDLGLYLELNYEKLNYKIKL